jgi:hypothetical protein
MPAWISGIQGIREILNSAGTALTRRKQLQFGSGFTAADDGTRTVVTLGAPSAGHAAALAPMLRGLGLTVNASNQLQVRPRPRKVLMQDAFCTGPGAGATVGIGALGWNLLGTGTPAIARAGFGLSSTSRFSLVTTNTSGHRSSLVLGDTEARGVMVAGDVGVLQAAVNFNSSVATKRFFFGLQADFSEEPSAAVNNLGIYYDSAVSPNYQAIARIASVGSPVVSAVAVPADTVGNLLTIYSPSAGTYEFRVDNTLIATISTGIPTVALNCGFRLETLAASAVTNRLGQFLFVSNTLANVLDNDTFLEV